MVKLISSINRKNVSLPLDNKKNKTNDDEVKSLQSQEDDLKKQLQTVRSSNSDAGTKQTSIKSLENQIQQIDSQIQQTQLNNATTTAKTNTNTNTKEDILISSSVLYKQMNMINATRKSFKGQSAVLTSDAALDEGHGSGNLAASEMQQAGRDDARADALSSKLGELNNNITKTLEKGDSKISEVQTSKTDKDNTSTDTINSKLDKNISKTSQANNSKNVENDSDKAKAIDMFA